MATEAEQINITTEALCQIPECEKKTKSSNLCFHCLRVTCDSCRVLSEDNVLLCELCHKSSKNKIKYSKRRKIEKTKNKKLQSNNEIKEHTQNINKQVKQYKPIESVKGDNLYIVGSKPLAVMYHNAEINATQNLFETDLALRAVWERRKQSLNSERLKMEVGIFEKFLPKQGSTEEKHPLYLYQCLKQLSILHAPNSIKFKYKKKAENISILGQPIANCKWITFISKHPKREVIGDLMCCITNALPMMTVSQEHCRAALSDAATKIQKELRHNVTNAFKKIKLDQIPKDTKPEDFQDKAVDEIFKIADLYFESSYDHKQIIDELNFDLISDSRQARSMILPAVIQFHSQRKLLFNQHKKKTKANVSKRKRRKAIRNNNNNNNNNNSNNKKEMELDHDGNNNDDD